MSNYTDYIPVPRASVVDIMEAYQDSTISGTGTIYMGNFYGNGAGLTSVSGVVRGTFLADDGGVDAPSYTFTNDTDTGMYLNSVGFLVFSAAGSSVFNISSTGMRILMAGSAAIPAIRINETDSGFYYEAPNTIGVSTSGTSRAIFSDSGLTLQNGTTVNKISTDTTLSGSSDTTIPTEKAVKTYVDDKPVAFGFIPHEADDAIATASGIVGVCIPQHMGGMNISRIVASVHVPGTTGTTDLQLRRNRAGADVDILSTKCTIDSGEHSSVTAAASFVVNTSNDDLEEGDIIYLDIDATQTTPPTGLTVSVSAVLP